MYMICNENDEFWADLYFTKDILVGKLFDTLYDAEKEFAFCVGFYPDIDSSIVKVTKAPVTSMVLYDAEGNIYRVGGYATDVFRIFFEDV